MNVLVIGGTRFFGIPMIEKLLEMEHQVTIATRGMTKDDFGDRVSRLKLNVYDPDSVKTALQGKAFDVVIDKMGYGSLDVKSILDAVSCRQFIHMSTAGVYCLNHFGIQESEFDPYTHELTWCTRGGEYHAVKQAAEAAMFQCYDHLQCIAVRAPYVLGKKDYTKRLLFYVEHTIKGIPMYIDNMDAKFSVAEADELGAYLAYLTKTNVRGGVNFCSRGEISVREILLLVQQYTGKTPLLGKYGDAGPWNGLESNSLCLDRLEQTGWNVSSVDDWVRDLVQYYCDLVIEERPLA